jgi:deoxyribonuclease IV
VPPRPVGAHARVTGGLATGSLRYAAAVGAEAIQVFAANPRGWAAAGGGRSDGQSGGPSPGSS